MFTLVDYCVFGCVITLCLFIGIYFGFWKKSKTADEYLLGNRSMSVAPISISLVTSHISGLTILGLPSDVYVYGANSVWICLAIVVASIIGYFVFLPTLVNLKRPNVYEYLHLRFDRRIQVIASCLYTIQVLCYCPVVAYIPAIAFSQATMVNPHIITPIVCAVCVFYTTIGGFKAVVWTHAIQFLGTITAVTAVFVLGILSVGGVDAILEKSLKTDRLDFNFSIDPTKRDGFWQMVIGCMATWLYNITFQPGTVQKYISLSTFKRVKVVMFLQCCGLVLIHLLCVFSGIIMYAQYEDCDPLSTGEVTRLDQIVPFFVMDVGRDITGLPGIFIAGTFCAALSSLSSTFNTLSATVYGDFITTFIPKKTIGDKETLILKLIVVISGCICTSLTFFVDRVGGLLAFVNASMGFGCGIQIGLFTLGVIFSMSNAKGAFFGAVAAFFGVGPVMVLNQWYTLKGAGESFAKPVSIEGCEIPVNITLPKTLFEQEQPFVLFRFSFWYNPVMSALVVTLVGLLVSYFTKNKMHIANPNLQKNDEEMNLPGLPSTTRKSILKGYSNHRIQGTKM
ncbi:sodium-coupled monocarboxylate transporter 2-like [Photinus pyralis]|uniref:sodium-coupled monocarboxylate transporter 2-like n=1 Tax=Photinus pyralis TaxID=7054 RepID=UPI0012677183|nr:sodium-coupled monocarboxylate transporter 2-like [Photinus pyralis]